MSFDERGLPRAYVTATHAAFGLGQGETGFVDDSPEVVRAAQLGLIEILPPPEPEPVTFNGRPLDDDTLQLVEAESAAPPQAHQERPERPQTPRGRRPRRMPPQTAETP